MFDLETFVGERIAVDAPQPGAVTLLHKQQTPTHVSARTDAGASYSAACLQEIATLNHEALDDSVKHATLVADWQPALVAVESHTHMSKASALDVSAPPTPHNQSTRIVHTDARQCRIAWCDNTVQARPVSNSQHTTA